jgi:hypothetical protein
MQIGKRREEKFSSFFENICGFWRNRLDLSEELGAFARAIIQNEN